MRRSFSKGVGRVKQLGYQRNFENYVDLLIVLLQKELKVRYKNKALGYLWSIANPLCFALVYYIAFSIIMRIEVEAYPLVLISGIFPWQWFANSVGSAPNQFVGNSSIIKKVNFPRNIIPLCTILNHMIHFIVSIPVIVLFLLIFQKTPSPTWFIGVPVLLLVQFLMVYGLALALSSINLFFRDLERLTSIVLQFVFYFTPIIYPIDLIPDKYQRFIPLNPVAPLIISWRELFLYGKLEPVYMLVSFGYGVLFCVIGYSIYRKLSWKFAEVI